MQSVTFTGDASNVGARPCSADQVGEQALALWVVQVKLGGGATVTMGWAAQPVINPVDGIERLAFAQLA
jgi:hypothetical protein